MTTSTSASTEASPRKYIYKIAPSNPVPISTRSTNEDGASPILPPSNLDVSSGFIHMSTASQVLGTLEHFFPTKPEERNVIFLLKVPLTSEIIEADKVLRWESPDATICGPREGEGLFPHLYFIESGAGKNSRLCLRKNEVEDVKEVVSDHGIVGWEDFVRSLVSENWLV